MKALAAFVQLKFKRTNIAVCYICNLDVVL
jgi:hypothetical protein